MYPGCTPRTPNAGWSCRGLEQMTYSAGLRADSILFDMAPQLNLVRWADETEHREQ